MTKETEKKQAKDSKSNLGPGKAPKLEDYEEGTSEHVGDGSYMKSSQKSSAQPLKKGKILVDLKHSGDYKGFDEAEKLATTKLLKLKETIRQDPLSCYSPELVEGLVMSISDMSFYRPDNPLQVLSRNMGEFSVAGFDKSSKTKNDEPAKKSESRKATNNSSKRPESRDSKQSKTSKASGKSKSSKKSKESKQSKQSKSKNSVVEEEESSEEKASEEKSENEKNSERKKKRPQEESKEKSDSKGQGEEEGDEEGEDEAEEAGEEGGEEAEEEGEEEAEEEQSKAGKKKN